MFSACSPRLGGGYSVGVILTEHAPHHECVHHFYGSLDSIPHHHSFIQLPTITASFNSPPSQLHSTPHHHSFIQFPTITASFNSPPSQLHSTPHHHSFIQLPTITASFNSPPSQLHEHSTSTCGIPKLLASPCSLHGYVLVSWHFVVLKVSLLLG